MASSLGTRVMPIVGRVSCAAYRCRYRYQWVWIIPSKLKVHASSKVSNFLKTMYRYSTIHEHTFTKPFQVWNVSIQCCLAPFCMQSVFSYGMSYIVRYIVHHMLHCTSCATSYIVCYVVHHTLHRMSYAASYIIRYIIHRIIHRTSYGTSYIVRCIVHRTHHTLHRTSFATLYIALLHRTLHATS